MKKIIIIGGGGHAKEVAATLLVNPEFEILGFMDDDEHKSTLLGLPRLGGIFPVTGRDDCQLVALGVGHVGNTEVRECIIEAYEAAGYVFATVVAPSAVVASGAKLGKGAYVAPGTVIQADASIGEFAIINTGAIVSHDSIVGRNTHLCPNVTLAGNVKVGDQTLVGIGAGVVQGITIGNKCFIAAGRTVVYKVGDGEKLGFLFK